MPNPKGGFFVGGGKMKKFLTVLMGLFLAFSAHAAEMVNVEYIHQLIKQKWDITIAYNPTVTNTKVAANMKYLLTAVDVANEILNGEKTTDYGNGEYATMHAADTVASIQAVDTLIKKKAINYPFSFTVSEDAGNEVMFAITAAGTFYIDWGDGTVETIEHSTVPDLSDESNFVYAHTYESAASNYTIRLGGKATEYVTEDGVWTILFLHVASIDGSLGAIFSTIGDGSRPGQQPSFAQMFANSPQLSGRIPENLFDGVHGQPTPSMFYQTFVNGAGLTGIIPSGLFSGISGVPVEQMFYGTFSGCSGLTGIGDGLFGNLSGAAQNEMFFNTFSGCTSLTGPSAPASSRQSWGWRPPTCSPGR